METNVNSKARLRPPRRTRSACEGLLFQAPTTKGGTQLKTIDHICSVFLRQILLRMRELGVTQTELAKRMNVSRPYITKILRHDVNFSFGTASKLAHALQMDFFPDLRPQSVSS